MSAWQAILFVALFVVACLWLLGLRRLARRLRKRHPDIADALGLEHFALVVPYETARNRAAKWALVRFVWRREYEALADPPLAARAGFLRRLVLPYVATFAILFVSVAAELAPGLEDTEIAPMPEPSAQPAPAAARAMGADQRLAELRAAVARDPTDFAASRALDRFLGSQRRYDECVALWDSYLIHVPGDAEAIFERGGSHYRRGDLVAAHADASAACELGKAEACGWAKRLEPKP